ncbi:MAG: hypothetical protein ABI685_11705 [Ferruginibacter sp.]
MNHKFTGKDTSNPFRVLLLAVIILYGVGNGHICLFKIREYRFKILPKPMASI